MFNLNVSTQIPYLYCMLNDKVTIHRHIMFSKIILTNCGSLKQI